MVNKLKIAQVVPSLLPTGPVNVALDLTAMFRSSGHDVDLFYFDEKEGAVDVSATKISFGEKRDWKGYDVVHSHGLRPDLYVRKNYKSLPPSVTTIHNYAGKDLAHTYNKLVASIFVPIWKWARSKHQTQVVLSHDMLNYYQRGSSKINFEVIPNTRLISSTQNAERINSIHQKANGKKIIGSLSTVTTVKGLEQVVEFLVQNEDWVYVHVGGGELEPLKELAKELLVSDRCFFFGHQVKGWEYVNAFDVFAIPSLSEGFPLSLIEAVQLEVPVVASNIEVFKEIFTSDEVSFFELFNIESLTEATELAYQEGKKLAEKAFGKYKRCYSPQVVEGAYLKCYRSVIK